MQVPSQVMIFLEVMFCRFWPISLSGTNTISSWGMASITAATFEDVQQASHSALTAA